jgi:YggT family protein
MNALFSILALLIHVLLIVYTYIIITRVVMSWLNPNPHHPAVRFIEQVTEPVLSRVRQFLPSFGGLDLSPVIVIFAILLVDRILQSIFRILLF